MWRAAFVPLKEESVEQKDDARREDKEVESLPETRERQDLFCFIINPFINKPKTLSDKNCISHHLRGTFTLLIIKDCAFYSTSCDGHLNINT